MNQNYPITVDYSHSVKDYLAAGRYVYTSSEITPEHFSLPHEKASEVIIELVHFNRMMTSHEVLEEFHRAGLRPINLYELLAFGEKYPDPQREFPIIELGSLWPLPNSFSGLVFLGKYNGGQGLGLGWVEGDWGAHCRFGAVKDSTMDDAKITD